MAKYSADEIPVCIPCDTGNITRTCKKCKVNFCPHYSSIIDIRFCANCVGDVSIRETIIEKVVERVKPDGQVSFSRAFYARRIKLEGVDWLFANELIVNTPDDKLDAAIEYHRANIDLLLLERQQRQLERSHQLARVKVKINTSANDKTVATKTAKTAKPSKQSKTTKPIKVDDMLKVLLKSFTADQLKNILEKK
jgi:Zn-finger nucleic acid-binding protein